MANADLEAARRVHDASLQLGAECPRDCLFFADTPSKSYITDRVKALLWSLRN